MICKPCRLAGALLPEVDVTQPMVRAQPEDVDHWHDRCKGGTHCDCQHVNTSALQREVKA